jgi:hypothetical protein
MAEDLGAVVHGFFTAMSLRESKSGVKKRF